MTTYPPTPFSCGVTPAVQALAFTEALVRFPRKGVRMRTPIGHTTAHPPAPAPRAGVTSHLPRLAGEAGRGCLSVPALARGGPAEA